MGNGGFYIGTAIHRILEAVMKSPACVPVLNSWKRVGKNCGVTVLVKKVGEKTEKFKAYEAYRVVK